VAKVTLKAGAELDLMSSDEHRQHLDRLKSDLLDWMRQTEGETLTRTGTTFVTNSSGTTAGPENGGYGIYRVPVGYDAFLTRCSVDYEGSDAADTVSCDLRISADNNTPAALRSLASVVPNVFAEGRSHAPLFRGGQLVVVSITGGPASTTFYCTVQVLLTKRKYTSADVLEGE
jgi:hypothetical protein